MYRTSLDSVLVPIIAAFVIAFAISAVSLSLAWSQLTPEYSNRLLVITICAIVIVLCGLYVSVIRKNAFIADLALYFEDTQAEHRALGRLTTLMRRVRDKQRTQVEFDNALRAYISLGVVEATLTDADVLLLVRKYEEEHGYVRNS